MSGRNEGKDDEVDVQRPDEVEEMRMRVYDERRRGKKWKFSDPSDPVQCECALYRFQAINPV